MKLYIVPRVISILSIVQCGGTNDLSLSSRADELNPDLLYRLFHGVLVVFVLVHWNQLRERDI